MPRRRLKRTSGLEGEGDSDREKERERDREHDKANEDLF